MCEVRKDIIDLIQDSQSRISNLELLSIELVAMTFGV
jgi:hypothetical protein